MHDRKVFLAIAVALAGTIANWLSVWRVYVADKSFAIDFGVFHGGGSLIRSDGYAAAYSPDTFGPYFVSEYYPALADESSVSHFISPPPFGWLMQWVSYVPFELALWIVMALGFLLLLPVVRALHLPLWSAAVLALSPAMVQNVRLGQIGPFVLVAVVALHLACSRSDVWRAGLIAGLFILKPTLAIGFALWWLIDIRRWYKAIAIAGLSGVVIAIPTFVAGIGPWTGFLDAMRFRVDAEGTWQQQSTSIPEWLKLASPLGPGGQTLIFWLVGIGVGAGLLVGAKRKFGDDLEAMSAVAVTVTVLASPHLLIYDTFILVIPVAVAAGRGLLNRDRIILLLGIHVGSIVFSSGLYDAQYTRFGRGIGFELVGLVVSIVLLMRWWDEAAEASSTAEEPAGSVPVVANH